MASASATTSSDAIERRFAALRSRGRRAFVPYVTAGYPTVERCLQLVRGLEDAGADVLEVGVPFSDPIADGPVIQASSQAALASGVTLERSLEIVSEAGVKIPVVLFTYLNPLLAAGSNVLDRAAAAGVSGLLLTDVPVGADPELEHRLGAGPLSFIRLVAPTTPKFRMAEIASHGSGFVYLISRLGVTGVREEPPDLAALVSTLREVTSLPVCAGFGVGSASAATAVARVTDGVVVGSALVRAAGSSIADALHLAQEIRRGIDAA